MIPHTSGCLQPKHLFPPIIQFLSFWTPDNPWLACYDPLKCYIMWTKLQKEKKKIVFVQISRILHVNFSFVAVHSITQLVGFYWCWPNFPGGANTFSGDASSHTGLCIRQVAVSWPLLPCQRPLYSHVSEYTLWLPLVQNQIWLTCAPKVKVIWEESFFMSTDTMGPLPERVCQVALKVFCGRHRVTWGGCNLQTHC